MKNYFIIPIVLALVVGLSAPLALAQTTGSVKGKCKDFDGKPIDGAQVEWTSADTGHAYNLKTNSKGEYFSLGISPGKYIVKLSKDGKEIYRFTGVNVGLDEVTLDFDMKKEAAAQAAGAGLTPEQQKAQQEQQAKAAKEKSTVGQLNQKLTDAKTASDAGDFDKAISILTEANAVDDTRDLIWVQLANAYVASAPKQTDPAEKKSRYATAAADYQKAIDLKKAADQNAKDPVAANRSLAAYYNNMAQAFSKQNKFDDAIAAYNKAAELDPKDAAMYYYNEGAVLTNAGRADEANTAFDKVIAMDPDKLERPDEAKKRLALAYYQKGTNLIGKETTDKNGKVVVPPGTAEAFQKYLELDPNGPMAQVSKDMLAQIGSTVETSFGKKKTTKK